MINSEQIKSLKYSAKVQLDTSNFKIELVRRLFHLQFWVQLCVSILVDVFSFLVDVKSWLRVEFSHLGKGHCSSSPPADTSLSLSPGHL